MEKFIVSARKYRPNNFVSLIGQESIAITLKNAIKRDQLAHAYLFCGPRGVGKTSTARIFAKTINCTNPGEDLEPCGECESCKSFAQGRSYCIHELDAASNNSVDDIRLLTEKVMIPPQVGKYSVYIIDEVHMLSSAAFNAFLKTLEEPPAHAIFILATTEKHKILPTILSRCQTYDFNRISIEDIVKNLSSIAKKENINIDTDSLHVIAQKADGAMRDALTLFDQTVAFCGSNIDYSAVIKNLNVLDYDYYFNLVECSLSGNYAKSLMLFDEILSKGFNALYFISGLSNHFRNLLVCKDSSTLSLLEMSPGIIEKYKMQSKKCSFKFIYEALSCTTKCEFEYKASSNQRLLVEFLLVKLSTLMEIASAAASAPAGVAGTAAGVGVASGATGGASAPSTGVGTASGATGGASAPSTGVGTAAGATASTLGSASEAATESGTELSGIKNASNNEGKANSAADNVAAGANAFMAGASGKQKAGAESKASGGISIKNIIKKVQSAPQSVRGELIVDNEQITLDKLEIAWEKMAQSQKQYPRLSTAILQTKPQLLEDGTTVVFNVGNSAQQAWIEKNSLPSLVGFLQKELRNGNLKMEVRVVEVQKQEKKLYMPHEKAEFLQKNNPQLIELRKDLDLDIK